MSLKDMMRADVSRILLNTSEHAETVTYVQMVNNVPTPTTINGIFNENAEHTVQDEDGLITHRVTQIGISTNPADGIQNPARGDSVLHTNDAGTIEVWSVVDVVNNNFGLAILELQKPEVVEKSRRDYRLMR